MAVQASTRYQVRYQKQDGTTYQAAVKEASSLWEVVQAAMELLDQGFEVTTIERVVTTNGPLTPREADTVRMLTNGRIKP
jgi:hypothetical protein